MRLVLTSRAQHDIKSKIDYRADRFGLQRAERTLDRIFEFLDDVVVRYPRTGRLDANLNIYESWIPRTPFVVLYRIDESRDCVIVLALFHHAEDRTGFEDE